MKGYLLDTNICIFYMKGRYQLDEKIAKVGQNNCYISEITVAELLFGAARSANKEKHLKQIASFIGQFKILPIYIPCLSLLIRKRSYMPKGSK